MLPSPMKPIRSGGRMPKGVPSLAMFGNDLGRRTKAVNGRGHSRIDRRMQEDPCDLARGHAIVERSASVGLHLVRAAEGREDREHDDAALAHGKTTFATPGCAPAVLVEQLLQGT